MKKKSGCFRFLLAFFLALVATILFRACTLKVYAANQMQLTLEETLAAYGRSFKASYYNINDGTNTDITLNYVGDTRRWLSTAQLADGCNIGFWGVSPSSQNLTTWQQLPPCLIYFAPVSGGIVPCGTDPYNYHTNITLQLPVEFENIGGFRQQIFWSGYLNDNNETGAYCTYTKSKIHASFGEQSFTALYSGWQNFNQRFMYGVWSPYDLSKYNFDESKLCYMQRFELFTYDSVNYSTLFDIYSIDCNFNSCGGVDLDGMKIDGVRYWGGYEGFYVLIGCPVLYYTDRTPIVSPITTAPYETAVTGIGTTETGVDLNSISTDIAEIIRNQRWQIRQNEIMIQNQGVQNDNLIRILTRLNDIYTQMLAGGELSPDLIPSDNLAPLPQDIQAQIQTALRGTFPTMPNNAFGDAPALVGEFWSLCTTDGFEIFMYLGCFCLACSVAAWVLFKGRG